MKPINKLKLLILDDLKERPESAEFCLSLLDRLTNSREVINRIPIKTWFDPIDFSALQYLCGDRANLLDVECEYVEVVDGEPTIYLLDKAQFKRVMKLGNFIHPTTGEIVDKTDSVGLGFVLTDFGRTLFDFGD